MRESRRLRRPALQDFEDLDPATASADDVEAAREEIDAAWEEVSAAAADVSEADDAALDAAWSDLADDLENIPDDEPVADVVAGLQGTAAEVRGVFQEMADEPGAPEAPNRPLEASLALTLGGLRCIIPRQFAYVCRATRP